MPNAKDLKDRSIKKRGSVLKNLSFLLLALSVSLYAYCFTIFVVIFSVVLVTVSIYIPFASCAPIESGMP